MIDRLKLSDNELVQRYLGGDYSALEVLINRYKDKIFSYIFVNVKDQHLAEDIFQDTFIKVVKSLNLGKYTDNGKFCSWAIRIAHNLIIDHYRHEKNANTILNESSQVNHFNSPNYSDENIEDFIINEQTLKEIHLLIDELPEDQREVVILRHFHDLSFREIAEKTNVSINTSLGRMRYAIINLRRIINERGVILTKM